MGLSFPKAGFVALVSAVALACGLPLATARAELLARVPSAREMAVCGDILFVGTKGSSVYALSLSGAAPAGSPPDFPMRTALPAHAAGCSSLRETA